MRSMIVAMVVLATLSGCGQSAGDSAARGRLVVIVLAGPTCPVELSEPCDPRPVNGASLVVEKANGDRVLELTVHGGRANSGNALAAGRYHLVAQRASGLMGTPPPVAFTVAAGRVTRLTVTYDTGIR